MSIVATLAGALQAQIETIEALLKSPTHEDLDGRFIALQHLDVYSLHVPEGYVQWNAVKMDWSNVTEVKVAPEGCTLMTRRQWLNWKLAECKNALRAATKTPLSK